MSIDLQELDTKKTFWNTTKVLWVLVVALVLVLVVGGWRYGEYRDAKARTEVTNTLSQSIYLETVKANGITSINFQDEKTGSNNYVCFMQNSAAYNALVQKLGGKQ